MSQGDEYIQQEIARLDAQIEAAKDLVGELGEEAQAEVKRLTELKESLVASTQKQDSGEDAPAEEFRAVIVEVRPGVGGDEAKIWADDLTRMYERFAGLNNWPVEILDECVIKIKNRNAWEKLRYETGVHRVQRVPETEAAGRIHTSTASVVILPEVPESVVEVREDDLTWEFVRGGGHGGQNVNKVATSVRLTHKPSGIVVKSSQERFQEQNRKIAMSMLRSQLWEIQEEERNAKLKSQRSKVGRSMRAEKIRTYNYPQNRVTDHRIGKSWYKLDRIIDGELSDVVSQTGEVLDSGEIVPEQPQE
jgi:peptide chain release factor 1